MDIKILGTGCVFAGRIPPADALKKLLSAR